MMDADGSNPETVAECDPDLFCDFPSWGAYDGPLPSLAVVRVRRAATASVVEQVGSPPRGTSHAARGASATEAQPLTPARRARRS